MNAEEIAAWSDAIWPGDIGDGRSTYTHEERKRLAQAVLDYVPKGGLIIEIGTYGGLSTSALVKAAREKGARVIACDPFRWNGEEAKAHLDVVLEMLKGDDLEFYPIYSEELRKQLGEVEVNLLHIDGEHFAAPLDCELWVPLVVPGGVVAFHDCVSDPRADQGFTVYTASEKYTEGWDTLWWGQKNGWLRLRRKP